MIMKNFLRWTKYNFSLFNSFSKQLEESKFMQFIDEDDENPRTGFPQQCIFPSISSYFP